MNIFTNPALVDGAIRIQVDRQRERKFRAIVRLALGTNAEVRSILVTTNGLLVTLKSGEEFEIIVNNRTGRP